MANAPAFDWVCERLESDSCLDRLAARGTIRLALKQAGFEARDVTTEQMDVILEKVLPGELSVRGVEHELEICERIRSGLKNAALAEPGGESPGEVFSRLGGG